jgi:gamma-glutamyltranspeptidase/glutathione hydrolase
VADSLGNVVAATPSCNDVQGSKGIDASTGVAHGSRLTSLNTTPEHPNRMEPGKRPRITLTPTMVLRDGKPIIAISVAGGDLQDQTTLNLLLNAIEFGMTPARAVTAPRFATECHENSFDPSAERAKTMVGRRLMVNPDLDSSCGGSLRERGHEITPVSEAIGHPVMLYIDPQTMVVRAAGDPNAGRHAAAVD